MGIKTGLVLAFALLSCAYALAHSQSLACSVRASTARNIVDDIQRNGLPRHYASDAERRASIEAIHCAERGENVRACTVRHCMGEST